MEGRTPKCARFFWTGERLPWIRWASPVTFKLMHPDWEVELHTDVPEPPDPWGGIKVLPIEKPPVVPDEVWNGVMPAVRSDLWRWWQLGEHGGLYADTDVVFCGSVQGLVDDLDAGGFKCGVTMDCGTRLGGGGTRLSIGVVTSHAGCDLFRRASEWLHQGASAYQSAGTAGLARLWPQLTEGVSVGNLPGHYFYPFEGNTSIMGRVWSGAYHLPESCLGIHWYGGRKVSIGDFNNLQPCPVKEALERSGWPDAGCPRE